MDVTPLIKSGTQIIQSYTGGVFKVSSLTYDHPVYVTPEDTCAWEVADVTTVADLTIQNFDMIVADSVDVVLLGAGAEMAFLPKTLKIQLKEAGLSVDIMDTGAACRTYNVLMAEGRRVACLLLPYN